MAVVSEHKEIWAPSGSTPWTLQTQFEVTKQSVENNTSTISLSGYLQSDKGLFAGSTNNSLVLVWHDNNTNVDKTVAILFITSASAGQRFNVSATYTATHKSDGTLQGYARTVWTKNNSNNYTPDSDYINTANTTLTSIPRASTPTVSPARFVLGESFKVKTNRKSSSFTHTIKVKYESTVLKTINNVGDNTTINSTDFESQLLNANKNVTSYSLTIECTTNGISGSKTCSVTAVTSAERHGPVLSNLVASETALDASKFANTTVTCLSNKHISVSVGSNNADISSVVCVNGDQTVAMDPRGNNYICDLVPTSEVYTVRATNSRGYTKTISLTQTLIAYSAPSFTKCEFDRTTDTGSNATLTVEGTYFNGTIGDTANTVTGRCRLNGGEWSSLSLTLSENTFKATKAFEGISYDQDFKMEVEIPDTMWKTASQTIFLRSEVPLFWMGRETARCARHWIFDGDGTNDSIEFFPTNESGEFDKGIKWGSSNLSKAIFATLAAAEWVKSDLVYSGTKALVTNNSTAESNNTVTFDLPSDFKKSLGCILQQSWPATNVTSAWSGLVDIVRDDTFDGVGRVVLRTNNAISYNIKIRLLYIPVEGSVATA